MKAINISLSGTPQDYQQSLLPLLIRHLGYQIRWSKPGTCDLLIRGAFSPHQSKPFRWLPKPVRPLIANLEQSFKNNIKSGSSSPLVLFHTSENIRHDAVDADFSISFDLSVKNDRHYRLPYWMEMLDWSHEGLRGNHNPRYGQLLSINRLMRPLGKEFLSRSRKAAIFSSHLHEPRATLVREVEGVVPLKGFGRHFDDSIRDHHRSGLIKFDVLQDFAFNLCPENGLYPGYYTEKIPEAFAAGCLPLTWTDTNVCFDFNPKAFINLEPMAFQDFAPLKDLLNSSSQLEAYADQSLLLTCPSIEPLRDFIREVVRQALS